LDGTAIKSIGFVSIDENEIMNYEIPSSIMQFSSAVRTDGGHWTGCGTGILLGLAMYLLRLLHSALAKWTKA
jgi:hypothetical protein